LAGQYSLVPSAKLKCNCKLAGIYKSDHRQVGGSLLSVVTDEIKSAGGSCLLDMSMVKKADY